MHRRSSPLFESTPETVFQNLVSWNDLVRRLDDLRLTGQEFVHVAAVAGRENVPAWFKSKDRPIGVVPLKSNNDLSLFGYERKFGGRSKQKTRGEFLLVRTAESSVFLVVAVATPFVWRMGISHLLDSLYPPAARPFLMQNELHDLLKDLHNSVQPRLLRVQEFSSKKRLPERAMKKFMSLREWTDEDVDSVFAESKESNQWFRSLSFSIMRDREGALVSTGTRGTLSKYAYLRCNGDFQIFAQAVVGKLIKTSVQRLAFFSNRDRSSRPDHTPKPLQITYEDTIFRSPDQAKRFVRALHKFRHGTVTVLHANPYVHLSVVDNLGLSSADVWVLSQNQILIVPQLRASDSALRRIVNHIFEDFREGDLSEFPKAI